jgi:membrane protease YdiL (CAAX protease family)
MTPLNEVIKSRNSTFMTITEIFVLLLLPLPFLNLNILYVVSAVMIMVLSKYLRKEKWSDFGFKSIQTRKIILAVTVGIGFGYVDNYLLEPFITKLIGLEPDLSAYAGVEGNVWGLIGMLALGWVIGGFFEEYFFRGYLFYRLNTIINNPLVHKCVAIAVTSIVFAFAHTYQGTAGILATFYFSIIMGLLYFYLGKNIWYLMIVHGFYDTVGIIKLFLGK